MSKINLKTKIKNKDGVHKFEGKGIKRDNVITYQDGSTLTILTIDKITKLERINEETLELQFKEGIKLKGKYITKYGNFKIETFTKKLEEKKIIYDLYINEQFIDTIEYNFEYSIDR